MAETAQAGTNVTPEQYANDIIWPTLALRKLAGERLTVTRDELVREFETRIRRGGQRTADRLSDQEKAEKLRPWPPPTRRTSATWPRATRKTRQPSMKGLIQPIRRHGA